MAPHVQTQLEAMQQIDADALCKMRPCGSEQLGTHASDSDAIACEMSAVLFGRAHALWTSFDTALPSISLGDASYPMPFVAFLLQNLSHCECSCRKLGDTPSAWKDTFDDVATAARELDRNLERLSQSLLPESDKTALCTLAPHFREVFFLLEHKRPSGRLSDRGIERPTDRSRCRSTERPSDRATERSTERPSDRATDRPSDRAIERPSDRPSDRAIEHPSDRQSDRAADRPTSRATERSTERPSDRPSD